MTAEPTAPIAADAPVVPPTWRIEQAVSAWQQMRAEFEADTDLELDEEVIASALKAADVDDPRSLLASIIDAAAWTDLRIAEAKRIEAEYFDRRARYQNRRERLRGLIEAMMRAIEVTKHNGRLARAAIIKAPPSTLITDEGQIPDEYVKTERTIRKLDLLADLKQGVVVPGASLIEGGSTLQIRRL
jgi:hypothetical protein